MTKALGIFSGGLDSILAVKVLQQQNIHVEAVTFVTPFFGAEIAERSIAQLGIPHHVRDITAPHFEMLKNPPHGYGRNMNPCIDCHALMFQMAGRMMAETGADFLFSGEVLGERPMSQNKNSLQVVARQSGFADVIIRPLSARLLPETEPERRGLVRREMLLSLEGRSRKPQIALAKQFGITTYPEPAGGCKLTDPAFSRRLRHLLDSVENVEVRDLMLLSVGRHLQVPGGPKIIIGRNEAENSRLRALSRPADTLLDIEEIPGPVVLIPGGADEQTVRLAASFCACYSDDTGNKAVEILVTQDEETQVMRATACAREEARKLLI